MKNIPLLPLRKTFLFPYMVVPLFVGRKKSISSLEKAVAKDKLIVATCQKNQDAEEPEEEDLYPLGTVAEILQVLKLPDGKVKVLLEGLYRAKLSNIKKDPFFSCSSKRLKFHSKKTKKAEALIRYVSKDFAEYAKLKGDVLNVNDILEIQEPDQFSDQVASCLQISLEKKEKLFTEAEPEKRLTALSFILSSEIEMLKLEKEIQQKVAKQMEKTKKEYLLSEKIKAIQDELGKEDYDETEEILAEIERAELPKEAKEKAERELCRLRKMPETMAERAIIRNYIDWLISLPWNKKNSEKIDIAEAKRILEENHLGLFKVKERVLEFLAVSKLAGRLPGSILCFVGPPGVGKSSVAQSIAKALGREFTRFSLGGLKDESEIKGHRMTYVAAMPGKILQMIRRMQSKNPVFLLDEIDKVSPYLLSSFLELLDPEHNSRFLDHYIDIPFDLSDLLFITTANTLHSIPSSLLDRMEIIEFPSYTEEEKLRIAKKFLIPKTTIGSGLPHLKVSDRAIKRVISCYTKEAGVRGAEKELTKICQKVAKEVVEGNKDKSQITVKNLTKYLGCPSYKEKSIGSANLPGVSYLLAYTEMGGEVLVCEVVTLPGSGKLYLTGKLGDIIKEQAETGLSYIRSKAERLSLQSDFDKRYDLHIHIPEGAIPKDGPSAGVAMVATMVSSLTNIPIKNGVAMTGEITLTGQILPVSGIKEKVLAAHRAGVSKVIIPKENERDILDIPKNVRKRLSILALSDMDEVIKEIGLIKVGSQ
ncbi:MAG: endopeptidase La [bacterium]|nr:endopeptidase La [bacterium]